MLSTAVKFGAFAAVCLGFTVYLAFTIGNISLEDLDPRAPDDLRLVAAFDDASGLLVNDPVKIAGVTVGKVTGIRVDRGQAMVTFTVDDDHEDLPADTRASVRWRNLIGQRFVALEPGDASTTIERDAVITDTDPVTDLGALFNSLGPIVGAIDESKVNEFLETVTGALDGNADRLGQALDDLATLSSGLASRDEAIGRLVENLNVVAGTIADRDAQIRTLLDNLTLLAGEFSANTGVVEQALVELGSFSTDLATLVATNRDELDRIIAGLDVAVDEQVRPRLEQLRGTLSALDEASRAVFLAGRHGEWLNQTILCAAAGPPPCATPLVPGAASVPVAGGGSASPPPPPAPPRPVAAGASAGSVDDAVAVITGLLGVAQR